MRIVKASTVRAWGRTHANAKRSLEFWLKVTAAAEWNNLADVRGTFPRADGVKVTSGRTVVVFDIAHNAYRLIAAIHYNMKTIFTLRFVTHAEYSKDKWKAEL